jgi:hypothetical protein
MAKEKHVAETALLAGLAGCSPMSEIGGAYFPAWLLCMLAGDLPSRVDTVAA